jgi:Domain of unknown function (DUF5615)
MLLLVDEDVPAGVCALLRSRGHEVQSVVDVFGAGDTPDRAVASLANVEHRIVVAFGQSELGRLICRAPTKGHDRFSSAGLIVFRCRPARAEARLQAFIGLIEQEHDLLTKSEHADRRLIVEIGDAMFTVIR